MFIPTTYVHYIPLLHAEGVAPAIPQERPDIQYEHQTEGELAEGVILIQKFLECHPE